MQPLTSLYRLVSSRVSGARPRPEWAIGWWLGRRQAKVGGSVGGRCGSIIHGLT
ncbi:MAG TPA: hypothetical protein ACFCUD_13030 [Cyclobacteriaceae bacterium]